MGFETRFLHIPVILTKVFLSFFKNQSICEIFIGVKYLFRNMKVVSIKKNFIFDLTLTFKALLHILGRFKNRLRTLIKDDNTHT